MKAFLVELRSALLATLGLAVLCCGLYPLAVYGLAQAFFHEKANGRLVSDVDGTVRGSRLLSQSFTNAACFHPRPSAAGSGYDPASSGGSNLGPTSQKLADLIRDRVTAYRQMNGLTPGTPVPADAVTASGSGLDPHISVRNAHLQAPRVARVRGIGLETVVSLIAAATEGPDWGCLGEPGVNVLRLNLALGTAPTDPTP